MGKIIEISRYLPCNMMISYINRLPDGECVLKQDKYFKKYKFYFGVLKALLLGINKEYIITFPKHIYEHYKDIYGNVYREYKTRDFWNKEELINGK